MATQELECLISKLHGIQKQLGGPLDGLVQKETDEFNRIKLALADGINFTAKKQDERDDIMQKTGRNMAVIKAGCEIRDKIDDSFKQLEQMKEALRRQRKNPKKYPANQIEVKEKQYENCRKMVEQLNARENGDAFEEEKPITLTEMKLKLGGGARDKSAHVQREMNQEETDALKAFKEKDRELDAIILQIDDGLTVLKGKAEMMGEKIDQQETQIADLNQEVTKTVAQLENSNTRLKKVLYQYRSPGKFCMEVVCLLILLGLIGVIIKLSTSGNL